MNFARFLRTPFLQKTSERLLLYEDNQCKSHESIVEEQLRPKTFNTTHQFVQILEKWKASTVACELLWKETVK